VEAIAIVETISAKTDFILIRKIMRDYGRFYARLPLKIESEPIGPKIRSKARVFYEPLKKCYFAK
jgi:hypothetical protein